MNEGADAIRRTRLANERTYLAWWRTALTSFAVSIGFALVGVFCASYAYRRHREVEEAVSRGDYAAADDRVILMLSGVGAVLGLLLMVVLLTSET
jgi:putative membrane protein